MVLVDTSVWIEWLTGSATGEALAQAMPTRDDWLVPTIVQLELVKWLRREAADDDEADRVIAFTQLCRIEPFDTKTALVAAELCRSARLATADAIVYATSRVYGADLLTCDPHFAKLAGVRYVAKIDA